MPARSASDVYRTLPLLDSNDAPLGFVRWLYRPVLWPLSPPQEDEGSRLCISKGAAYSARFFRFLRSLLVPPCSVEDRGGEQSSLSSNRRSWVVRLLSNQVM